MFGTQRGQGGGELKFKKNRVVEVRFAN